MTNDKLSVAAKEVGAEDGLRIAQTVSNKTVNLIAAKAVLKDYEDGDYSMCPDPMSGEWADDPSPVQVLAKIAKRADTKQLENKKIDDDTDDLLDIYEESYRESFWEHVTTVCKGIVANG